MNCPNCGKDASGSKFCPECGATLTGEVTPEAQSVIKKPKKKRWV